MTTKRILMCVVAVTCLLLPASVLSQAEQQVQPAYLFQEIIQLVEENNPILESQRSLIATIERAPDPGAGFINLEELQSRTHQVGEEGVEVPLLSLSEVIQVEQFVQTKLDREKTLAEAQQTYENLKQSLISNLMAKMTQIAKLRNQGENLEELKSFLERRQDSLEKQVKAGIKQPAVLFDLTERLMQANLETKNAAREGEILRLETAISLGGTKWEGLLALLNKV